MVVMEALTRLLKSPSRDLALVGCACLSVIG